MHYLTTVTVKYHFSLLLYKVTLKDEKDIIDSKVLPVLEFRQLNVSSGSFLTIIIHPFSYTSS